MVCDPPDEADAGLGVQPAYARLVIGRIEPAIEGEGREPKPLLVGLPDIDRRRVGGGEPLDGVDRSMERSAEVERSAALRHLVDRLELREPLAAHYRDARRATAEAVRTMFGPAAEHLRGEPEVMAVLLIALFDGLVLQWLLEPDAIPSGDAQITALVETMALALEEVAVDA